MKINLASPSWTRPQEKLPKSEERVIVVCEGYRCLGYVDRHGTWRQDSDGTPIEGVVGWGQIDD